MCKTFMLDVLLAPEYTSEKHFANVLFGKTFFFDKIDNIYIQIYW